METVNVVDFSQMKDLKELLEEKLSKIIKDINEGTLKKENIKKATEMKKYL